MCVARPGFESLLGLMFLAKRPGGLVVRAPALERHVSGFESLVVLVLHRCLRAQFEGLRPKYHKLPFTERNFSPC